MPAPRNDADWTADLASSNPSLRDDAVKDLWYMLLRGLSKTLSKTGRVEEPFLEDVVQEATVKILAHLGEFEGRSKFRTWAVTIAVRTALGKMRQREWQNVSLESLTSNAQFDPQIAVDRSLTTEQANRRLELLGQLKQAIERQLTERQRIALTAELSGMPLPQIAEKLVSNTNSIYKLLHDARKKLRQSLEAAGFTIDDLREAWI